MIHRILQASLALLMPVALFAQVTPPPPPGGAPPGMPLPGILVLLISAVTLGIYKHISNKPKK